MKYISLDLETTCLSPKKPENILMLSMVVEDTKDIKPVEELPHFTCFMAHGDDVYTGQSGALAMNSWIFDILSGKTKTEYPIYKFDDPYLKIAIEDFFASSGIGLGKKFLAGKNVATFDYLFLPQWLKDHFKKRIIDPGSVFIDFESEEVIRRLDTLKESLGLGNTVAHDAREDALDVIRILRNKYEKK